MQTYCFDRIQKGVDKMKCLFCKKKNIWIYPTEDGDGICKECILLAALSLREKEIVIKDLKEQKLLKNFG